MSEAPIALILMPLSVEVSVLTTKPQSDGVWRPFGYTLSAVLRTRVVQ